MLNSDKENHGVDLDLPKKRAKIISAVPSSSSAAGPSRNRVNPSQVLSPKSHNSRTLPASPLRTASPGKSFLARPVSPAKPVAPQMTMAHANGSATSIMPPPDKSLRGTKPQRTTSKATTAGSMRGRKGVATEAAAAPKIRARAPSSDSASSATSAGTTVLKKKTAPAKARTGLIGKVTSLASAAGRKAVVPAKKDNAEPAKRVLRSRKAA
jgi:hypothetical protein